MSCVLRDSTISLKEKRKEHISLSEPPTVKGISRSKMSCLKGATVDACRIFSSPLSVSTSTGRQHHVSVPKDAVVVQVSRAECWLWLSRTARSSHHSKPIFDELQSPHSVALWNFLFWGGGWNLRVVSTPAHLPSLLFSSFTFFFLYFFLPDFCMFSHLVVVNPPGVGCILGWMCH